MRKRPELKQFTNSWRVQRIRRKTIMLLLHIILHTTYLVAINQIESTEDTILHYARQEVTTEWLFFYFLLSRITAD